MKKILALLLLSTSLAHAQVKQSGNITPGHPAMWTTNGVISDGGPPSNGALSGLGTTFNGTAYCQNSNFPTNGAYNQLCLGTTTTGGGYLSFFNKAGATGGLFFNVNGTIYPFPFSGTGTVTSITAGSNITLTPNPYTSTCTTAATDGGGSGGVSMVSVVSANGLAGSVANPTTTPAITLSTTITGLLKGNGTAISAASPGTDYLAPTGNGSGLTGLTWSQIGTTPTTLAGYGITDGLSSTLAHNSIFLGNGSNIATASTLTAAIDAAFGTTQGSILYRNSTVWTLLPPGTNGYFLQTQGASANPTYAPASGGTGCNTGGSANNMLTADGAGGCTTDTNTSLVNGGLTLGASGTVGSLTMGNATSGTVKIQPVTGPLGSVTASLPANTGIIAELNYAQTWSAAQSFNNGDLLLNGSSSGAGTLEAPAVASTYVWTAPASSGHLAGYDIAQTWTAAQTYTNSDLLLLGSSTGATTFTSDNAGASNYTMHVPAANDTLVSLAATQTLTFKTLTASNDVLGGVTMTLGSDATGDVYYRNSGGVLTRLGIGSTGQVLTVAAGLPSWAAAPGGSGYGGEQHFTTNHTVVNGDASTNLDMDCATACQVVLPTGITNNVQFHVIATNVGSVQIVSAGVPVTVNSGVGTTIYLAGLGAGSLVYNNYNAGGQNAWYVTGNIAP